MSGAAASVPADHGATLVLLARAEVERAARGASPTALALAELADWLRAPRATFVTLRLRGAGGDDLRGCIGSLEPRSPLALDLVHNARAAACRDPRFPPLAPDELPRLRVEVSVLSPMERLNVTTLEEARGTLRRGVDGVLLRRHHLSGTFLPQVWEQLPEPGDFLARLAEKAGLCPRHWDDGCELYRYTVEKFAESYGAPLRDLLVRGRGTFDLDAFREQPRDPGLRD